MLFYRRDPNYGYSPAAGCFGSLLATLVIVTFLIVCAIYIGFYVLVGLLIIGAIVGGLTAVFSLLKTLPQTVKDMSSQIYHGNKVVVLLKNVGYFFVCLAKYSISNDVQYAKNAFQKFSSQRVLSFSKWINLAWGITVLVFGLLMLLGILSSVFFLAASLLIFVINVIIVSIGIMIGIGFLCNMFFVVKEAVHSGKQSFSPVCFKFLGRCYFSDLLSVPKTFMIQMGKWIGTTWTNSMSLLGNYKSWLNTKHWIWFPLSIAFIISCPLSALIFIAVASLIMLVVALPVYLLDAIWILIKAIFKF